MFVRRTVIKWGTSCQLHDHYAKRHWRYLDTCRYRTILHAVPRARSARGEIIRGRVVQPLHGAV
jgi:hypothetical protein